MTATFLEITWENIYAPILGIGMIFLIAMIASYGIAFLSKLFGIGVKTRSGQVIANPTTFDNVNQGLSLQGKKIIERIKSNFDSSYHKITSDRVDKIDKLKELQTLMNGGIITQSELEVLKKEILSL